MDGVVLGAVFVLATISLLNLALLWGVVRRIRDHEERLLAVTSVSTEVMAPAGSTVAPFTVVSVAGETVESTALRSPTLVGFFSPQCDACHERIADFRQAARDHSGSALSVVMRDGGDAEALVADLQGTSTVVVEDPDGPVMRAFGVRGFPAFALLAEDGRIETAGFELPLAFRWSTSQR